MPDERLSERMRQAARTHVIVHDGDVRYHATEVDARLQDFAAKVKTLEQQLAQAQRNSICDVCAGSGDPKTGIPCVCGGSGLACDAVNGFRKELAQAIRERDDLRLRCDALEKALKDSAALSKSASKQCTCSSPTCGCHEPLGPHDGFLCGDCTENCVQTKEWRTT